MPNGVGRVLAGEPEPPQLVVWHELLDQRKELSLLGGTPALLFARSRARPAKARLGGCPGRSDPISARGCASSLRGTRRCWGGSRQGRSWRQENKNASRQRPQLWRTFSIFL